MIYTFSKKIPINTPPENPVFLDVILDVGIIHQVDFVFPPGVARLAGVSVHQGVHKLWPSYSDDYFVTDGEVISFKEFYEVRKGLELFTIYFYNQDDTYAHTLTVRFGVLKRDQIQGVWLPWSEEVVA